MTRDIYSFHEITEKDFESFRKKIEIVNFLQSVELFKRYQGTGKEAYLVGLEKDRKLVAATLISASFSRKVKTFTTPGGPLFLDQKSLSIFIPHLEAFAKQKGGDILNLNPYNREENLTTGEKDFSIKKLLEKSGFSDLTTSLQKDWQYIYCRDLKGETEESLRMSFRQTTRQKIRDGLKFTSVREINLSEIEAFHKVLETTAKLRGFATPSAAYLVKFKEYFGDKARLMVAETEDKKIAAASMFIIEKGEIVYLYSGSIPELQKTSGIFALQWHMILEALHNNCKRYNFYGVIPEDGNGVYEFKKQFHGYVEKLVGTWSKPLSLKGKLSLKLHSLIRH